jgi:hypothetical protein
VKLVSDLKRDVAEIWKQKHRNTRSVEGAKELFRKASNAMATIMPF